MNSLNQVKIGFTGTRRGMSMNQKRMLRYVMTRFYDVVEFHHGAAIGADTEAVEIVTTLGRWENSPQIIPHPAKKNPLARNRTIVSKVGILIAAPATDREVLRSGTWATIRYAQQRDIAVVMLPRGGRR